MQCNVCGTLLPSGAGSCPKCGALLYTSSDYDAIPYIDTKEYKEYQEQVVLPAQPVVVSTIEQPLLPAEPGKYPEQKRSSGIPGWMMALIILFSLLLIGEGIGSAIYTVNYRPADLHAQATKVAQNFLGAQVTGTAQANAQAMATANAMTPEQVYQQATSGTPVIDDPLKDDSGNVWYHYGAANDDGCSFRAGAYHVQASFASMICTGVGTSFHDLAFQTQVTIVKGLFGGVMFRDTGSGSNAGGYIFIISSTGDYNFSILNQQQTKFLKTGISSAIVGGFNQPNLLTVIARGSHIYLYINGQTVTSLVDSTFTFGQIAFTSTTANGTGSFDTAFNNVKVWDL
jgi:hypothetical protein